MDLLPSSYPEAIPITSTEALALIRDLPGEGRIIHQIYPPGELGLIFQFEGGQEVRYAAGEWTSCQSDELRERWAAHKAVEARQ